MRSNRLKILYIHHGYGIGGAPLSLLFLLQKLDLKKYEPTVLCLHGGPAVDLYRQEGIETYVDTSITGFGHTTLIWYRLSRPWQLVYLLLEILRFIPSVYATTRFLEEHPVDLVHLNSSGLVACAIGARRAGVPVVWHIREPIAHGYLGIRRNLFRKCIHRFSDRVIAICQDNAAQLIPSDRIRVIYNFVDFGEFDRNIEGDAFRSEWNLLAGTKVVGMLGGVHSPKGTREFVLALHHVRQVFPNVRFVIVGSFPGSEQAQNLSSKAKNVFNRYYYHQIRSIIERYDLHNSIILTGVRRDIPHVIAGLDLLVFPSTVPHFARPIIEAGAMAKPVVASDLGGPRELVMDGETGFLVPPSDPRALAKAIIRILGDDDLARRMGEAGNQQARRLFDAEVNAQQTVEVYEELLAERGR